MPRGSSSGSPLLRPNWLYSRLMSSWPKEAHSAPVWPSKRLRLSLLSSLLAIRLGAGFVTSLARPGGNVTGLSGFGPELVGKRLELLKQAIPGVDRVAV